MIEDIQKGKKGLAHLQDAIPIDTGGHKGKPISQYKWAKLAGMEEHYNVVYRLFSGNIHPSEPSYEDDLCIEDDKISAFLVGPRTENMNRLLVTIFEYALMTLEIIVNYFQISNTAYETLKSDFAMLKNKEFPDCLGD